MPALTAGAKGIEAIHANCIRARFLAFLTDLIIRRISRQNADTGISRSFTYFNHFSGQFRGGAKILNIFKLGAFSQNLLNGDIGRIVIIEERFDVLPEQFENIIVGFGRIHLNLEINVFVIFF